MLIEVRAAHPIGSVNVSLNVRDLKANDAPVVVTFDRIMGRREKVVVRHHGGDFLVPENVSLSVETLRRIAASPAISNDPFGREAGRPVRTRQVEIDRLHEVAARIAYVDGTMWKVVPEPVLNVHVMYEPNRDATPRTLFTAIADVLLGTHTEKVTSFRLDEAASIESFMRVLCPEQDSFDVDLPKYDIHDASVLRHRGELESLNYAAKVLVDYMGKDGRTPEWAALEEEITAVRADDSDLARLRDALAAASKRYRLSSTNMALARYAAFETYSSPTDARSP